MLHTAFNKCHEAGAYPEGYRKLAKALGGVNKYGKDTPIPLSKIVESNGLLDAIWTLRCTLEPSKDIQIEFASTCAEHVLHFYEDKYPNDDRPRKAIEAARACITDKSQAVWAAARDVARAAARAAWEAAGAAAEADAEAAWAAAEAAAEAAEAAAGAAAWAAGDAAGAAAWAAARAAAEADAEADEREWQTKTFLGLLKKK